MWNSIKQAAVRLYGGPHVQFVETSTTLAVEVPTGSAETKHFQLYDELLRLPRGSCMRQRVRAEGRTFLFALTSVAMVELERRYSDSVEAPTRLQWHGPDRHAA